MKCKKTSYYGTVLATGGNDDSQTTQEGGATDVPDPVLSTLTTSTKTAEKRRHDGDDDDGEGDVNGRNGGDDGGDVDFDEEEDTDKLVIDTQGMETQERNELGEMFEYVTKGGKKVKVHTQLFLFPSNLH